VALLGGYGADLFNWFGSGANVQADWISRAGILIVPLLAMGGAFAAALFVYRWSLRQGHVSVSSLLLAGLALNSIAGALMTGLQTLLLDDFHVTRAIVSWGFGALNDRGPVHAAIAWAGVCCALPAIPGLGLELDLLGGGEQDAASMGANVARVKTLALLAIAICTATAVAVSGQIAFVGLLVPHLVRRLSGPRHRWLLLNSFLLGGFLLLAAVVFQNGFCPWLAGALNRSGWERLAALSRRVVSLQPGVLTSLFGAPFFLYVLLKQSTPNPRA
jgi:iron complex transport system permease protein